MQTIQLGNVCQSIIYVIMSEKYSFSDVLEAASNGQFAADDRKLKVR
jgi:hypothetical protein